MIRAALLTVFSLSPLSPLSPLSVVLLLPGCRTAPSEGAPPAPSGLALALAPPGALGSRAAGGVVAEADRKTLGPPLGAAEDEGEGPGDPLAPPSLDGGLGPLDPGAVEL